MVPMSGVTEQLETLIAQGLIHPAGDAPDPGFRFRHALVQEAAYQSILHQDRARLHQIIAETLLSLFPNRTNELAPTLAQHLDQAGQHAVARDYYLQAGDQAFQQYANSEAAAHYRRALELSPEEGELPAETLRHLYLRRGRALELVGEFQAALANYEALERWSDQAGRQNALLDALVHKAEIHCTANELFDAAEGTALCTRALDLAKKLNRRLAEARVHRSLLNVHRLSERNAAAVEAGERSLSILRELASPSPTPPEVREQLAFTLNDYAHARMSVGGPADSLPYLEEARRLWRSMDNRPMLADNLATTVLPFFSIGEYEKALAFSDEAFRLSQSIQNEWGMSYSRFLVGLIHWENGDLDRAIRVMDETIQLGDRSGFVIAQIIVRWFKAWLLLDLGDAPGALEIARQLEPRATLLSTAAGPPTAALRMEIHANQGDVESAAALDRQVRDPDEGMNAFYRYFTHRARRELAFARQDYDTANRIYEQIRAEMGDLHFRGFLLHEQLRHAETLTALGREEEARRALNSAAETAESVGSRWFAWRLLQALGARAETRGDAKIANELRSRAEVYLSYALDHLSDPDLKASFHQLPEVRWVLGGRSNKPAG